MILIQKGQRQSSESWASRTPAWNLARLIEGEVCLSPLINAHEMHDLCSQDLQSVPGNVFLKHSRPETYQVTVHVGFTALCAVRNHVTPFHCREQCLNDIRLTHQWSLAVARWSYQLEHHNSGLACCE
jgi:hypothetical protein